MPYVQYKGGMGGEKKLEEGTNRVRNRRAESLLTTLAWTNVSCDTRERERENEVGRILYIEEFRCRGHILVLTACSDGVVLADHIADAK